MTDNGSPAQQAGPASTPELDLEKIMPERLTATVTLRGVAYTVTELRFADEQAIDRQIPEPRPADEDAPATVRQKIHNQEVLCKERRIALIAFAAAGFRHAGQAWTRDRDAAWCLAAINALGEHFASAEILRLFFAAKSLAEQADDPASAIGSETESGN